MLPHLVIINYIVNQTGRATQPNLSRNLDRNHFLLLLIFYHLYVWVIRSCHFQTVWTGKSQNRHI